MHGWVWMHEVIANSGLVELLLAGDTTVCATIGVMIGCVIGRRKLQGQLSQD